MFSKAINLLQIASPIKVHAFVPSLSGVFMRSNGGLSGTEDVFCAIVLSDSSKALDWLTESQPRTQALTFAHPPLRKDPGILWSRVTY